MCSKGKASGNWETEEVAETQEVTSSSSALELVDTKATGGALAIKCAATDVGWIEENFDDVSGIKFTKCARVSGSCESEKELKVIPLNLPWATELREETGGEIRDRLQAAGKGPGYKIECTVGGIFKIADECAGALTTKMTNNRSTDTVEAEFDSKSGKIECTSGGKEAGEIKGIDTIKRQGGDVMVGPRGAVYRTGGDLLFGTLGGGVKKLTGRTERFRFENNVAVTYTAATVTGVGFTQLNTTCNGAKAAGSTCVTEVEFKPMVAGAFAGVIGLDFTAGNTNGVYRAILPGIGLA